MVCHPFPNIHGSRTGGSILWTTSIEHVNYPTGICGSFFSARTWQNEAKTSCLCKTTIATFGKQSFRACYQSTYSSWCWTCWNSCAGSAGKRTTGGSWEISSVLVPSWCSSDTVTPKKHRMHRTLMFLRFQFSCWCISIELRAELQWRLSTT